jgi:hypothetical protein
MVEVCVQCEKLRSHAKMYPSYSRDLEVTAHYDIQWRYQSLNDIMHPSED